MNTSSSHREHHSHDGRPKSTGEHSEAGRAHEVDETAQVDPNNQEAGIDHTPPEDPPE